MKNILKIGIVFFILIFLGIIFAIEKKPFDVSPKEELEANNILKNLTLEQKIGQLFIIGIDGKEPTKDTEDLIKKLHPGGILLLGKNIGDEEQVKKLTLDLQKIAITDTGLPLFIAVD